MVEYDKYIQIPYDGFYEYSQYSNLNWDARMEESCQDSNMCSR